MQGDDRSRTHRLRFSALYRTSGEAIAEIERDRRVAETRASYFNAHVDDAKRIAPNAQDAAEHASWTMLANVLLNMDEDDDEGVTDHYTRRSPPPHQTTLLSNVWVRHRLARAGLGHESTAVRTSSGGKSAAFRPESKEHHLSIHGRWSVAARSYSTANRRLRKYDGQPCPEDLIKESVSPLSEAYRNYWVLLTNFGKLGTAGAELSALLPQLATVADDIAIVKSLHTTQFNHAPAQIFMNTGHQIPGRPSMGAWLTYGIGSESKDLPGFVVLLSGKNAPDGGKSCWGPGFLPSDYQGVELRRSGDPVLFLSNPDGVDRRRRAGGLSTC